MADLKELPAERPQGRHRRERHPAPAHLRHRPRADLPRPLRRRRAARSSRSKNGHRTPGHDRLGLPERRLSETPIDNRQTNETEILAPEPTRTSQGRRHRAGPALPQQHEPGDRASPVARQHAEADAGQLHRLRRLHARRSAGIPGRASRTTTGAGGRCHDPGPLTFNKVLRTLRAAQGLRQLPARPRPRRRIRPRRPQHRRCLRHRRRHVRLGENQQHLHRSGRRQDQRPQDPLRLARARHRRRHRLLRHAARRCRTAARASPSPR